MLLSMIVFMHGIALLSLVLLCASLCTQQYCLHDISSYDSNSDSSFIHGNNIGNKKTLIIFTEKAATNHAMKIHAWDQKIAAEITHKNHNKNRNKDQNPSAPRVGHGLQI